MVKGPLQNLYATLEISDDADELTIKKAYRQLVLKWHPDKTPDDREKAEERIRNLNAAYATLSNPAKRERYDLQRAAMDGKQRGQAPSKPRASPKVLAPKEFMLQPLGHPERFLRYAEGDKRIHAHTRQDVNVTYEEFFKTTRLALWWLPEVNNMCRVRALGVKARGDKRAAAAGVAGGLNFSFRVREGFESEVRLAAAPRGKRSDNVNVVMKASPEYEGAYRFEVAAKRGYYLCFYPPSDVRIASLLDDQEDRVLDFMLTDFSQSLNYKDLEEVLCLVASPNIDLWVRLKELISAKEVAEYFERVMQKPVWDLEDFVAHVRGHWQDWEFNEEACKVRLRPLPERLSELFVKSQDMLEVVEAIRRAGEELTEISLQAALRATMLIAQDRDFADAPVRTHAAEQLKLVKALPDVLENATKKSAGLLPSPSVLLDLCAKVPGLVGESPLPPELQRGKSSIQLLTRLIVARLTYSEDDKKADEEEKTKSAPDGFAADDVVRLLKLPNIADSEPAIKDVCGKVLAGAEKSYLLSVARTANSVGCSGIADVAGSIALEALCPAEEADKNWTSQEMIKLLLTTSRQASQMDKETKASFLAKAYLVLRKHLPQLALTELVRVVLPASYFGPSDLMDAVAAETAIRLDDFGLSQLLLVTQALLQGLSPSSSHWSRLLDFWAKKLGDGPRAKTAVCSNMYTPASGQISVQQLLKLMTGLFPVLRHASLSGSDTHKSFVEASCSQLLEHMVEVSDESRAELAAELQSNGALVTFSQSAALSKALQRSAAADKRKRSNELAELQLGPKKKKRRR